jgi:aminoglycoside 3-N-acetyltransferase
MDRQQASPVAVTEEEIVAGLRALGLDQDSSVVVHSSLRSFGRVEGGAPAVCRALLSVCGTVLLPAGSWHLTGVPAPPGLIRPNNAVLVAESWDEFDTALARAVPFTPESPIDRELGVIPETMRLTVAHARSMHPLLSYIAVGQHAETLVRAQRLDWPLGPLEALAALDGNVLLLGVTQTTNTTIHLAEQRLGRSRFFRYAKAAPGVWMELPNIPGQSHRFDDLAPALAGQTNKVLIGTCLAQRIAIQSALDVATRAIRIDPAALLCDDPECRCGAALQQRLASIAGSHGDKS